MPDLQRAPRMNRRSMVIVLTAILLSVPPVRTQRLCDSPVPGIPSPSRVSVFVAGFSSSTGDFTQVSVSHLNYHEMTNQFNFPALFAGFRLADARVAHPGETERKVRVQLVTGSYFDVLQIRAQRGRTLYADEDRPEDNPSIAVISHALWNSMFHFDPDAVGQRVTVNGRPVTIIGIAPPGFHGVLQSAEETLWLPGASMNGANDRAAEGYAHFVVRLGEDVTWEQARRHFGKLPAALAKAFPDVNDKFKTLSFYDLGPLSCVAR